jgi:hypothetical protein
LSRVASLGVLIVGIAFGLLTNNILDVMMWIVGALYGGYVIANVLKWYWWRFNGYGYFWGMLAGIMGAMIVPELVPKIAPHIFPPQLAAIIQSNSLYVIPVLIVLSLAGCLLGTFLTEPEDAATLKHFYKTTRPWGFWGPIRDQVIAEDPTFQPNQNVLRDCTNVAVGIVWQLCLTSLPIFLVLRSWNWAGPVFLLLIVLSIFIKLNWYDKLPATESAEAA